MNTTFEAVEAEWFALNHRMNTPEFKELPANEQAAISSTADELFHQRTALRGSKIIPQHVEDVVLDSRDKFQRAQRFGIGEPVMLHYTIDRLDEYLTIDDFVALPGDELADLRAILMRWAKEIDAEQARRTA